MSRITLKGNAFNTIGSLPKTGSIAPDFSLVNSELTGMSLQDFRGSKVVLNIFPSIDTGTCAASVRAFNKSATDLQQVKVLCISRDLPFAQSRFCGAEGLTNVINLSDYQTGKFGKDYGLEIVDGPLAHLHSRVVIVLNKEGEVIYSEQVPEIVDEPNYSAALAALE